MKSFWKRLFLVGALLISALLPAQAEWRKDIGIFRVGIVPEGDRASFFAKLESFRFSMMQALQMEVEFYPASDATAIIDALRSERIEYGILPASAYALAWNVCECVEPLVVPRSSDQTDGFFSILITRLDGPQSLSDLKGASLGFLSQGSITNHKIPVELLEQEGVSFDKNGSQITLFDTPTQSVEALIAGNVDALMGWSSMTGDPSTGYTRGTLSRIYSAIGDEVRQYRVLWQSPQFPHHPHIVRRKIDGEAKRIIRDTLLNLFDQDPVAYDAIEPVLGGGFTATRQDRFSALIDYIDRLYQKPETPVLDNPELKATEPEKSTGPKINDEISEPAQ